MINRDAEEFINPIRTEEEHKRAVSRIIEILGAEEGSPEDRELDALVEAVKTYEDETVESCFPGFIRLTSQKTGLGNYSCSIFGRSQRIYSRVRVSFREVPCMEVGARVTEVSYESRFRGNNAWGSSALLALRGAGLSHPHSTSI